MLQDFETFPPDMLLLRVTLSFNTCCCCGIIQHLLLCDVDPLGGPGTIMWVAPLALSCGWPRHYRSTPAALLLLLVLLRLPLPPSSSESLKPRLVIPSGSEVTVEMITHHAGDAAATHMPVSRGRAASPCRLQRCKHVVKIVSSEWCNSGGVLVLSNLPSLR